MSLEDKDVDTLNNEELDQNTDTNVDTDNTDTGTDDLDSVDDSEVESDIDSDLCTAADPCKKIFGEGKFRRDFAEDHPDRITFRFGEYYL